MSVFVDLDKGGNYGYSDEVMGMGPTHGLVPKPTRLERIITTGVASTVQQWDAVIMLKLAAPAVYTLTLLPVRLWMKFPYGQITLLVKFLNDNSGNALTVLPAGADTIDGLASISSAPIVGMAPFPSIGIRPRTDLLGWIIT